MTKLSSLPNAKKQSRRVGRGIGSGVGKTCGRGEKGAGSRSGYKRRHGYEGGQFRLFMKLPIRGFSNARFCRRYKTINLDQINTIFGDGEVVNEASLRTHGYLSGKCAGIKVLARGELTKKVEIEAAAFSKEAEEKLRRLKISFKRIEIVREEKE